MAGMLQTGTSTRGIEWQVIGVLSMGYWPLFMYGHWAIAFMNGITKIDWWISYPGFSAVALLLVGLVVLSDAPICGKKFADWLAAAAMLSCALLIGFVFPDALLPVSICGFVASVAQIWLQAQWWNRFVCADTKNIALSFCVGTIMVALLKIAMSFLLVSFTVLAAILPVLSALCLRLPLKETPRRPQVWFSGKVVLSLWRVIIAVATFYVMWAFTNALLKSNTGHYAFGTTSTPTLTILIQTIVIVFALTFAWWIGWRKSSIEYVQLWRVAYVCFTASLFLLINLGLVQIVQVFSSAAFPMAYFLVNLASADIARHSSFKPYFVFAFSDLLYEVTDWAGRGLVSEYGISSISISVVMVFIFISMLMIAFFLPNRTVGSQYLLADLNGDIPQPEAHQMIDERCVQIAEVKGLSSRETEIMRYLCRGRSKPYIAEALYLSNNTVGTYTRRLYQKLGVHNKQDLINLVLPERD